MLVVDDDPALSEMLGIVLQGDGFEPFFVADGSRALEAFRHTRPDLVLLDVMLPGKDGIAVLDGMRGRGLATPVLMLTARSRVDDRVSALDVGADDYLTKPFDFREFEARVRALLRRSGGVASSRLKLGDVELDQVSRSVTVAGKPCELTRREVALLEVFMLRPRKLFTKAELIDQLFGFDRDAGENAIELYVGRLRKKLGPARLEIRTQRGLGYQAVAHEG